MEASRNGQSRASNSPKSRSRYRDSFVIAVCVTSSLEVNGRSFRIWFRRCGLGLALSLSFALAEAKQLFPKAEVTRENVQDAIRTEWDLRKHYDTLPADGETWFKVLEGKARILISAPHATAQTRENESKPADAGTGALAVMLHKLSDATVIYTTCRSPSDPNFYDDNDYKRELRRLIEQKRPKLVIDLHASHWYRPYDVDFGTLGGESLGRHPGWLTRFAEILRASGLRDFSQDYFAASKNENGNEVRLQTPSAVRSDGD